jgi:hypothetical protein
MTSGSNFAIRAAVDKLAVWRRHRRDLRELAELDGGVFSAIARDLCLSSADLQSLGKAGEGRTVNLGRLLDALGIAEAVISRTEPAVMRDMERVCALCVAKARCGRDLRAASSRRTYREYCPNSATIDAL